jgi:hypothetical protein
LSFHCQSRNRSASPVSVNRKTGFNVGLTGDTALHGLRVTAIPIYIRHFGSQQDNARLLKGHIKNPGFLTYPESRHADSGIRAWDLGLTASERHRVFTPPRLLWEDDYVLSGCFTSQCPSRVVKM